MGVVRTYYYTDPACPWSWAMEPALRKLQVEFGESLRFTYVMSGMARDFGPPAALIGDMLAAAERSGMPVDPRLWLEGAPTSSYPACMAVKAAGEQGDPGPYLRRLREGLMCRRRKLDSAEALIEEARSLAAHGGGPAMNLNVERFRVDLGSHATVEAFGRDLDRAAAVPREHHAPGTDRVKLPSLEFKRDDGSVHGVYGYADYEALRAAVLAAGAQPAVTERLSPEQAVRHFGSMTTAEVAAVCELPGPRAPAELWRLATEWRVRAERVGSGELWSAA